jgi:hypothetical protein
MPLLSAIARRPAISIEVQQSVDHLEHRYEQGQPEFRMLDCMLLSFAHRSDVLGGSGNRSWP